jgi:hypothetical protein
MLDIILKLQIKYVDIFGNVHKHHLSYLFIHVFFLI